MASCVGSGVDEADVACRVSQAGMCEPRLAGKAVVPGRATGAEGGMKATDAETGGEGGHLFGEEEVAARGGRHVGGEAFDFGEVVGGEEDGGGSAAADGVRRGGLR